MYNKPVPFGKHKGKTLPVIVFNDPDWFFWAYGKALFIEYRLARNAVAIYHKARSVAIPRRDPSKFEVEYLIDGISRKLASVHIVRTDKPQHVGGSIGVRADHFDLALPRTLAARDRRGGQIVIKAVKRCYFGDAELKLTADQCERFFADPKNFL